MMAAFSATDAAVGTLKPLLPPPFKVSVMLLLDSLAAGRDDSTMPLSLKSKVPAKAWLAVTLIFVTLTSEEKALL